MKVKQYARGGAIIASAVVFVVSAAASAAAQGPKVAGRYSATTAGLSAGDGINISIDILRWSTDEEADKLVAAFKDKGDKWADALDAAPSVGYVWPAEANLGYSVKLAHQLPLS